MMQLIHRHRKAFLLLNGLLIVAFSGGALLSPGSFWPVFGVAAGNLYLDRVLAWYLLTLGIGGLFVARAPEQQPLVVGLLGLEKAGAVFVFVLHLLKVRFNLPLCLVAGLDAALMLLLLSYSRWLVRAHARR